MRMGDPRPAAFDFPLKSWPAELPRAQKILPVDDVNRLLVRQVYHLGVHSAQGSTILHTMAQTGESR